MDSRKVPPQYLTAGQEYLEALVSLGLIPHFLGWGWDAAARQWLLVLVTSIVDAGGPLALNRLLFRAYNAKATPKQISPFIVRIFSPDIVPRDFWHLGEKNLQVSAAGKKDFEPKKVQNVQMTFLGLELEMINSYQTLPHAARRRKYQDRREQWSRFKRNVEKLAA